MLLEDEVRDQIEYQFDYVVEDGGIGSYAYGDGNYTDIQQYLRLTTDFVMVKYPQSKDGFIYQTVRGYFLDSESEYEAAYEAVLNSVTWDGDASETKQYRAEYEIIQH